MAKRSKPSQADFVDAVRSHLGATYVFGAAGPKTFDCSGLVQYSLHQIGINAPRTSEEQFVWVDRVSTAQPGDLVFFSGAEGEQPPGHVGVIVSPGRMIDAPFTGAVVRYDVFSESGVGVNEFMGYGRVPGLAGSASSNSNYGTVRQGRPTKTQQQASSLAGIVGMGFMLILAVAGFALLLIVGWMVFRKKA